MILRDSSSTLGDTLSAVFSSTRVPDEFVAIVDDRTTDNSADIVRRFGGQVRFVRWHGWGAQRNEVFKFLQTDYTLLLDDDMIVPPDFIEKAEFVLGDDEGVGAVSCPYSVKLRQRTIWALWLERRRNVVLLQTQPKYPAYASLATTAIVMFRRSALEKIGFFEDSLKLGHEDSNMFHKLRRDWNIAILDTSAIHIEDRDEVLKRQFQFGRSWFGYSKVTDGIPAATRTMKYVLAGLFYPGVGVLIIGMFYKFHLKFSPQLSQTARLRLSVLEEIALLFHSAGMLISLLESAHKKAATSEVVRRS